MFKEIIVKNFPKLMKRHQPTNPKSSANPKEDKLKHTHISVHKVHIHIEHHQ